MFGWQGRTDDVNSRRGQLINIPIRFESLSSGVVTTLLKPPYNIAISRDHINRFVYISPSDHLAWAQYAFWKTERPLTWLGFWSDRAEKCGAESQISNAAVRKSDETGPRQWCKDAETAYCRHTDTSRGLFSCRPSSMWITSSEVTSHVDPLLYFNQIAHGHCRSCHYSKCRFHPTQQLHQSHFSWSGPVYRFPAKTYWACITHTLRFPQETFLCTRIDGHITVACVVNTGIYWQRWTLEIVLFLT